MTQQHKLRLLLIYTPIHLLAGLWVVTDEATCNWFKELHPFILAVLGLYWVWYMVCAPMMMAAVEGGDL